MKEVSIRPYSPEDKEKLDEFRFRYPDADLEIPHGFTGKGLETVIAVNGDKLISSATGTLAIIIDPLIANPDAAPSEILSGLFKQEATITYLAKLNGALDSFIAIPKTLTRYIALLEKCGYEQTAEHCVIMRRPLVADTEPRLGEIRDSVLAQSNKEDNKI
jgi:hypothetical protein